MTMLTGLHPVTAVLELYPAPIEDDKQKWFITEDQNMNPPPPNIREAACGGACNRNGRPDHKT